MSDKSARYTGKEEPNDRRSQRTRGMLISALLALIETKHYDQITVQDIVERANVGRSTFYAHFENKDQLLYFGFEQMLDMLVEHLTVSDENQLVFDISMLFQHARGHYEIYRTLIWGSGFELLTCDGLVALSRKIENHLSTLKIGMSSAIVPLSILSYSMAGSILLLLKWWLENKMPYPPERMNEIFQELVMPDIRRTIELKM